MQMHKMVSIAKAISKKKRDIHLINKMMDEHHEVVIVGAGIAGLATALALKRVGIESLVLERAHKLRTTGAALSLFPNAWRALEVLGVAHKLAPLYQPFKIGRVTNLNTGVTQDISFTGTTKRDGGRALHRKALLEALAEELSPGTIRFSSTVSSIKTQVLRDSSTITLLELENGAVIRAKVLIGCDGVHSVVAQWLGLAAPIDSGRAAFRALSTFPQGHDFKHEVRMFIELGKRAGFLSLNDTEIYWFITHNTTDTEKEMLRGDPKAIQREIVENVAKNFPSEFLQIVHNTDLSTLSWAPFMYRSPWNVITGNIHKGCVTVAGDAFHPMTPDIAQGGGTALEDAVVLARNIRCALNSDGIEKYVKERKWRAAGLILGAYLSGWVQQGGHSGLLGWMAKWFRDHIFYRFVQPMIADAIQYDCGLLQ